MENVLSKYHNNANAPFSKNSEWYCVGVWMLTTGWYWLMHSLLMLTTGWYWPMHSLLMTLLLHISKTMWFQETDAYHVLEIHRFCYNEMWHVFSNFWNPRSCTSRPQHQIKHQHSFREVVLYKLRSKLCILNTIGIQY